MGEAALRAVPAKPAVAQEGEILLSDVLTCEYSGQDQIEDGRPMVQAASRDPKERDFSEVGNQKHGAEEDGGTVVNLGRPGETYAVTGHIVGIYAHPAGNQDKVASLGELRANYVADDFRIVRSKVESRDPGAQCLDFACKNRCKAVLNKTVVYFAPCNHQPCAGSSQGFDGKRVTFCMAIAAARSTGVCFIMRGMARVAATISPFLTRVLL